MPQLNQPEKRSSSLLAPEGGNGHGRGSGFLEEMGEIEAQRRSRLVIAAFLAFALVVGVAITFKVLQQRSAARKLATLEVAPALTVSVTPLGRRMINQKLELNGSVSAWDLLPILSSANGLKIMQILVEEGDKVSKGQTLAILDSAMLQAQDIQARARLAEAQAGLAKMRRPWRAQDIASLKSGVAQAVAQRDAARDQFNRIKELAAEGAVTTSELIARQSALQAAEAGVDQARQRLSMGLEGSRSEDIRLAEGQVQEARGAVALIEAQLAQTRVLAPASGYILSRAARLGDVTGGGQRLFTMVREGRLELDAQVPEADLRTVRAGQLARVTSAADPSLHATGRIREIAPGIDTVSRLGMVKLNLPPNSGFKVGQFARAVIGVGRHEALALPTQALQQKEGGAAVYVVKDGIAHTRAVHIGIRDGNWVEILDGVTPGEQIVTAGAGYLKDGDTVRVEPAINPATPASGAPSPTALSPGERAL